MDLPTANDKPTIIAPGYFVYIIANQARTVFYVSVTGYLSRKLSQHATGDGYEYGKGIMPSCKDFIYWESHEEAADALRRSEKIKIWNHTKISELVARSNPEWKSLNDDVMKKSTPLL